MAEHIRLARDGHMLTITLDRPEKLNALNARACVELSEAFDAFSAEDDLWVAIVTGEGRAFCAGHDLTDDAEEPMPATGWAGIARRRNLVKPLICAVNGDAMGGGWELALACDVVIADERARFGLPEPRVGLAAVGGGAWRLPKRLPWHVAMELLLTGNKIDAASAQRLGVVNRVAPAGTALEVAKLCAGEMLRCAPIALQATKTLAMAAVEPDDLARDLFASGSEWLAKLLNSDDGKEGISAFQEKREPRWRGR